MNPQLYPRAHQVSFCRDFYDVLDVSIQTLPNVLGLNMFLNNSTVPLFQNGANMSMDDKVINSLLFISYIFILLQKTIPQFNPSSRLIILS